MAIKADFPKPNNQDTKLSTVNNADSCYAILHTTIYPNAADTKENLGSTRTNTPHSAKLR